MSSHKIIGITGGIGSGKSFIATLINSLGYPIYNSDYEAKRLYKNRSIREKVMSVFGSDVFTGNELNKEVLSSKVFGDTYLLTQLNNIIHPAVKAHFDNWAADQECSIVFKEAAILIESGAYKHCDAIITVAAPESTRISRVMARDGVSESDVRLRMSKQLTDLERESYANWTILNDGTTSVIRQIMALHHKNFEV